MNKKTIQQKDPFNKMLQVRLPKRQMSVGAKASMSKLFAWKQGLLSFGNLCENTQTSVEPLPTCICIYVGTYASQVLLLNTAQTIGVMRGKNVY
jgi:hypothetical protein